MLILVGSFSSFAKQRKGKKTEKKTNTIRNTWMTRFEAMLRAHQNLELVEEFAEKKNSSAIHRIKPLIDLVKFEEAIR